MIRSKVALISSFILFSICLYLFFPFPNNEMLDVRVTVMSFPISDQNGYIPLGIVGVILFIFAIILLAIGMKKYHLRTIIVVVLIYSLLPNFLITVYQEMLASGITAISYDGEGRCDFNQVEKDLLNGECSLELYNRSNEAVSFEMEFVDSYFDEDGVRMESLMNLAGPYLITLEGNHKETIHFQELLELSDVSNHIEGGSSYGIHIKLINGEEERIL